MTKIKLDFLKMAQFTEDSRHQFRVTLRQKHCADKPFTLRK